MAGRICTPIRAQAMFAHDKFGAAATDNRTDREGIVVLVLKFFRIGIDFVACSYANIARTIRRCFRRHADFFATGQFVTDINIFTSWQVDIVVLTIFLVATDVYTAVNYECIAVEIHTTAVTRRLVSGDAAAAHCKRSEATSLAVHINTAAISGCNVTSDFHRIGNGHITIRVTVIKHSGAVCRLIVFNHAFAGYCEVTIVRPYTAAISIRRVITNRAAVHLHRTAHDRHATAVCFRSVVADGTVIHDKLTAALHIYTTAAIAVTGILNFLIVIADGAAIHFKCAVLYFHTCTAVPPAVNIRMIAADRAAVHDKGSRASLSNPHTLSFCSGRMGDCAAAYAVTKYELCILIHLDGLTVPTVSGGAC